MNLLIIGAGGHGKVVKETAEAMNKYLNIEFLDDNSDAAIGRFNEYEKYRNAFSHAFVAIGDNKLRSKWMKNLEEAGYIVPTLIHSTAYISVSSLISSGVIVLPKAVVHTNAFIKQGSIIGIGSLIDHDTIVNEFCHINSGAIVKPGSKVKSYTEVEAGKVYIEKYSKQKDILKEGVLSLWFI